MNMNEIEAMDDIHATCFTGDTVVDHVRADSVLCRFLRDLGYNNLVDLYEQVDKYYA